MQKEHWCVRMPKISVVIPAFNEEKHIRAGALEKIEADEIIVVNDGSTDNTEEAIKKAMSRDERITLISYEQNRGKGYAMRQGALAAANDTIVFTESDRQFSHSDIPKLAQALENADIVIGKRENKHSIPNRRRMNLFLTKLATFLATGHWYHDPLSGFRAIRKKDFEALGLHEDRFNIEAEMNTKAIWRGLRRIKYVPVIVTYHSKEFNKFNWKDAKSLAKYLTRAVFRHA